MKKALKLAVIYIMFLVLGTIFGTILYSLFLNLLNFVAGQEITFFSNSELFRAFFYVLYCMLFFMPALISYYRIRHPSGFLQLLVYILLCVLTWVVLIPCTMTLQKFCENRFDIAEEKINLSPNYFRQVDDTVYYFTRDFEAKDGNIEEAPAVVISTTENGKVEFKSIKNYDTLDVKRHAAPYREIQLKKIFGSDSNPVPVDFKVLIERVTTAFSGGLRYWLTLLSFALLLSSVYGLTNFFDWRLLNAVFIFISTACILSFNSIYFLSDFADIKIKLTGNGFFRNFGKIVDEPLLFIINCFFALLFIGAGVIKLAVRKHAAKAK